MDDFREKQIKIALIGNMNNNFFSMMRYFHALGVEAHLFKYLNESDIFSPQNDTWEYDKWGPFIHELGISMHVKSLYFAKKNKEILKKIDDEYHIIIGNGLAPALFSLIKRPLDMFVPYSDFIEGTNPIIIGNKLSLREVRKMLGRFLIRRKQIPAIQKAKYTILPEYSFEETVKFAKKIGNVNLCKLNMPMVYNLEKMPRELDNELDIYINKIRNSSLSIFSHARHLWKTLTDYEGIPYEGKRNDILIQGFAQYIDESKNDKALLVFLEYGPDVENSKKLIKKYGIEKNVLWIPKLPRKKIMYLLQLADICGGQFGAATWGGAGLEILASGKIMLQKAREPTEKNLNFPNILPVNTVEDVKMHLLAYEKNSEYYQKLGNENKIWFNKFCGLNLANKYLDLITSIIDNK